MASARSRAVLALVLMVALVSVKSMDTSGSEADDFWDDEPEKGNDGPKESGSSNEPGGEDALSDDEEESGGSPKDTDTPTDKEEDAETPTDKEEDSETPTDKEDDAETPTDKDVPPAKDDEDSEDKGEEPKKEDPDAPDLKKLEEKMAKEEEEHNAQHEKELDRIRDAGHVDPAKIMAIEVSPEMASVYQVLSEVFGRGENFAKIDDESAKDQDVIGKFSSQFDFTPPKSSEDSSSEDTESDKESGSPSDKLHPHSDRAEEVGKYIGYLYESNAIAIDQQKYTVECDKKVKVLSDSAKIAYSLGGNLKMEGFGVGLNVAAALKNQKKTEENKLNAAGQCRVSIMSASIHPSVAKTMLPINAEAHKRWLELPLIDIGAPTDCAEYGAWFDWFNMYGTHYVKGVKLGGSLTVTGSVHGRSDYERMAMELDSAVKASLRKIAQAAMTGLDFDPSKLAEMSVGQIAAKNAQLAKLLKAINQDLELNVKSKASYKAAQTFDRETSKVSYSILGGDPKHSPIVEKGDGSVFIDAELFPTWQNSLPNKPAAISFVYGMMSEIHEDSADTKRAQSYQNALNVYQAIAKRYTYLQYLSTMISGRIMHYSDLMSNLGLQTLDQHRQNQLWVEYKILMSECEVLGQIYLAKQPLKSVFDIHHLSASPAKECRHILSKAASVLGAEKTGLAAYGDGVLDIFSPKSISTESGIVLRAHDIVAGTIEKRINGFHLKDWHTRYVEIGEQGVTWWENIDRKKTTIRFIPYERIVGVIVGLPKTMRGDGFQLVTEDRSYIFRFSKDRQPIDSSVNNDLFLYKMSRRVDRFLMKNTEVPIYDLDLSSMSKDVKKTITIKDIIGTTIPTCTEIPKKPIKPAKEPVKPRKEVEEESVKPTETVEEEPVKPVQKETVIKERTKSDKVVEEEAEAMAKAEVHITGDKTTH